MESPSTPTCFNSWIQFETISRYRASSGTPSHMSRAPFYRRESDRLYPGAVVKVAKRAVHREANGCLGGMQRGAVRALRAPHLVLYAFWLAAIAAMATLMAFISIIAPGSLRVESSEFSSPHRAPSGPSLWRMPILGRMLPVPILVVKAWYSRARRRGLWHLRARSL